MGRWMHVPQHGQANQQGSEVDDEEVVGCVCVCWGEEDGGCVCVGSRSNLKSNGGEADAGPKGSLWEKANPALLMLKACGLFVVRSQR